MKAFLRSRFLCLVSVLVLELPGCVVPAEPADQPVLVVRTTREVPGEVPAEQAGLSVCDNGPGVTAEASQRLRAAGVWRCWCKNPSSSNA